MTISNNEYTNENQIIQTTQISSVLSLRIERNWNPLSSTIANEMLVNEVEWETSTTGTLVWPYRLLFAVEDPFINIG